MTTTQQMSTATDSLLRSHKKWLRQYWAAAAGDRDLDADAPYLRAPAPSDLHIRAIALRDALRDFLDAAPECRSARLFEMVAFEGSTPGQGATVGDVLAAGRSMRAEVAALRTREPADAKVGFHEAIAGVPALDLPATPERTLRRAAANRTRAVLLGVSHKGSPAAQRYSVAGLKALAEARAQKKTRQPERQIAAGNGGAGLQQ